MRRPSISKKNSLIRKCDIVIESICVRKKDLPHYHDYVQLWYVFSGILRHTVDGKEYLQTPGTCVIVRPFTDHAIDTLDSDDTPVTLSLSFTDDFLTRRGYDFFSFGGGGMRFENRLLAEFTALDGEEKERADELGRNMLSEFAPGKKPDFGRICAFLHDFLTSFCTDSEIVRDTTLGVEQIRAVLRAVAYMSDNFEKQITREKLCSVTAMSRTNLSRIFKAITGSTMKNLIISLRLRRAQYLLQFTDRSLNEIATETGLYDKSRLTNLFRVSFGISPIRFREETRPDALRSDKLSRRRISFYPKIPPTDTE